MKKVLLPVTLLMILATTVTLWSTKNNNTAIPPADAPVAEQDAPAIGGGFTLTDQHGKEVKDADFRGRLMLVFFGFTHCPDICPVTTKNLSEMMTVLGDKADQVAPIFITIDPERDTPAVMNSYFSNFDKRIVGLTGTPEQIKEAASAYKAYYAKSQPEDEQVQEEQTEEEPEMTDVDDSKEAQDDHHHGKDDYLMDHSGYIYLMDRDGKYVTHFQYDATPQALADALKKHLK